MNRSCAVIAATVVLSFVGGNGYPLRAATTDGPTREGVSRLADLGKSFKSLGLPSFSGFSLSEILRNHSEELTAGLNQIFPGSPGALSPALAPIKAGGPASTRANLNNFGPFVGSSGENDKTHPIQGGLRVLATEPSARFETTANIIYTGGSGGESPKDPVEAAGPANHEINSPLKHHPSHLGPPSSIQKNPPVPPFHMDSDFRYMRSVEDYTGHPLWFPAIFIVVSLIVFYIVTQYLAQQNNSTPTDQPVQQVAPPPF